MTSRERVRLALSHREPDRVPFDLAATRVTGIHREAYRNLRDALGLPKKNPEIGDINQQLAKVEEVVLEALRVDTRGVFPSAPSGWTFLPREEEEYFSYPDEWGLHRRMPREGGHYFDLVGHPLAGAEGPEAVAKYPWPDPADPARFAGMADRARAAAGAGKAVCVSGLCAGLLEMGLWLRGFERFFMDLAEESAFAEALLDKILELKLAYWRVLLPQLAGNVDVAMEGDDMGTQTGLLVSPAAYRKFIKPRQTILFGEIKKLAPVKVFYHSCGAIRKILPDLIEAGVDILNPVQASATGMDPVKLKRSFGKDLVFWGGGVDTQQTLPGGTPEEVKDEVRRRIEVFAPGGGFVFTPVHNIQADVPPANILAMREALDTYGNYGANRQGEAS
ncbi:MAG: uroporphyrinogen decarboxylase family protein [Planctomycetota bacterium]